MLDTPSPDLSDARLRLGGTRFTLVEFPFMVIPPNGPRALFELKMAGWAPVLAHPERYGNASAEFGDAEEWRRVGAHLQVNCGSLLGRYGAKAQQLAWGLLERGWVDYLSSDYHARGTCPVAECRRALQGLAQAHQHPRHDLGVRPVAHEGLQLRLRDGGGLDEHLDYLPFHPAQRAAPAPRCCRHAARRDVRAVAPRGHRVGARQSSPARRQRVAAPEEVTEFTTKERRERRSSPLPVR